MKTLLKYVMVGSVIGTLSGCFAITGEPVTVIGADDPLAENIIITSYYYDTSKVNVVRGDPDVGKYDVFLRSITDKDSNIESIQFYVQIRTWVNAEWDRLSFLVDNERKTVSGNVVKFSPSCSGGQCSYLRETVFPLDVESVEKLASGSDESIVLRLSSTTSTAKTDVSIMRDEIELFVRTRESFIHRNRTPSAPR